MVDRVSGSGLYQLVSTLKVWNGTGPSVLVGSNPITLQVNRLSSSSDGDGESVNLKNRFQVVIVGSGLFRSSMRDRWGAYLLLRLRYNLTKL